MRIPPLAIMLCIALVFSVMATTRDHGNKLSVVVDILMRDFSGDASLVAGADPGLTVGGCLSG